jgi:WD40 repeat protein
MFRKMVLLLVIMLSGSRLLYCYDPIDTVWCNITTVQSISHYQLSPDNNYLIVVGDHNEDEPYYPHLYDTESGTLIKEFEGWCPKYYTGVCFSPDSRYIVATGTMTNKAVSWDVETGQIYREFIYSKNASSTSCLAFSPSGDTLVFESNAMLIFWNFSNGEVLDSFLLYQELNEVNKIVYSPIGDKIVLQVYGKNYFFLLDLNDPIHYKKIANHNDRIISINFSGDGTKIISTDAGGKVYIVNSVDTSIFKYFDLSGYYDVCQDAIMNNSNDFLIATGIYWGTNDGSLLIIDLVDYSVIKNYYTQSTRCILSTDEEYLYCTDGLYLT